MRSIPNEHDFARVPPLKWLSVVETPNLKILSTSADLEYILVSG